MTLPAAEAQEKNQLRDQRLSLAVTDHEKRAAQAIAAVRGTEPSNLLRELSLTEIVKEFDRIMAAAETGVA